MIYGLSGLRPVMAEGNVGPCKAATIPLTIALYVVAYPGTIGRQLLCSPDFKSPERHI